MTREINDANSDKGTIQGGRDGGLPHSVRVVRNTTVESNFATAALWLNRSGEGSGYYDIYGLDEARKLYEAIGEVLADYDQMIEDAKPKLLTDSELLALKRGTIVEFPEGSGDSYAGTKWMRLGWGNEGNDFVKLNTELAGSMNSAWALRDKLIVSSKED